MWDVSQGIVHAMSHGYSIDLQMLTMINLTNYGAHCNTCCSAWCHVQHILALQRCPRSSVGGLCSRLLQARYLQLDGKLHSHNLHSSDSNAV